MIFLYKGIIFLKVESGYRTFEGAVNIGGQIACYKQLSDHGTEAVAAHKVGAYTHDNGIAFEHLFHKIDYSRYLKV